MVAPEGNVSLKAAASNQRAASIQNAEFMNAATPLASPARTSAWPEREIATKTTEGYAASEP
jgi:hypothetical protein